MSDQKLTAEVLQITIEHAFADVPYPGDDNIVIRAEFLDMERDEVERAFKGKHWRDVLACPLEFLRYHYSALFDFTPEAYQFYLPAYLIAIVENYVGVDVVTGSVIYSLRPDASLPETIPFYKKRMKILTISQREAIKSFLIFLQSEHPDDDPLGYIDHALKEVSPE